MTTNHMLVNLATSPNFTSYHPVHNLQPQHDLDPDSDEDYDVIDVSKFCETILEEFQHSADLAEDLRNFIRIAPKPEDMKDIAAYLLNLRRKAKLLGPPLKPAKGKKNYPCADCGKVFGWPTDLKRHALIHSGLRPFSCPHCEARFNRNCLLRKHVSRLHPGLKLK